MRAASEATNAVLTTTTNERALRAAPAFRWQPVAGSYVSFPLPIDIEVNRTAGEILAEHGTEQFYHLAAGGAFTLRDLFAAAKIAPDETFTNREELLDRFERRPIDIQGYLSTRSVVSKLVTPETFQSIDDQNGGRLGIIGTAPATAIADLAAGSPLAAALSDATIADVAGMNVDQILERVPEADRALIAAEARIVQLRAGRITRLVEPDRR